MKGGGAMGGGRKAGGREEDERKLHVHVCMYNAVCGYACVVQPQYCQITVHTEAG